MTRHASVQVKELLMSYSPPEELDLDPVGCDESAITEGEEGGEVGAAPEQERGDTTSGKLQNIVSG